MMKSSKMLRPVMLAVLASFAIVQLTSCLPAAAGQSTSLRERASAIRDLSGYGDGGLEYPYDDESGGGSVDGDDEMVDDEMVDDEMVDDASMVDDSVSEKEIESYFKVEYEANSDATLEDVCTAAEALATAYNRLIEEGDFVDPFNRRMTTVNGVDVLSVTFFEENTRALTEVDGHNVHPPRARALQNGTGDGTGFRILAILQQRGTASTACPGNCNYSNDSLRRRLGFGNFEGFDGWYDPFSSFRGNPMPDDVSGTLSTLSTSPFTRQSDGDGTEVLLPTQLEIRDAYNDEIEMMNIPIVGVISLSERNVKPEPPSGGQTFTDVDCSSGGIGEGSSDGSGSKSKSSGSKSSGSSVNKSGKSDGGGIGGGGGTGKSSKTTKSSKRSGGKGSKRRQRKVPV